MNVSAKPRIATNEPGGTASGESIRSTGKTAGMSGKPGRAPGTSSVVEAVSWPTATSTSS